MLEEKDMLYVIAVVLVIAGGLFAGTGSVFIRRAKTFTNGAFLIIAGVVWVAAGVWFGVMS